MRTAYQLFKGSFPKSLMVTVLLAGAVTVLADLLTIDFESYTLGNINGQDGWSKTGGYDVAVVTNSYGFATFGTKSLRISNAVTSGSFGDHTFSKALTNDAGESTLSDAEDGGLSGGTRQPYFEAEWDFASTVPGAEQPGLSVVASPDRGDGARMSWVQMADTPAGLEVNFYDYQISANPPTGDFVLTNVISGLDRTVPHRIKITMEFVDGPENDVVKIFVDGALLHTGTSWEDYFRQNQPPGTRTVDAILFRVGGTAAPATAGKGFLIDNFRILSGPVPCTTDCYVDDAIGNDANGGTNPTTDAKKTIQNAVNTVNVSGTVHVAGGTYVEQVEIDKTVTVRGAGATTVVQSPNALTKYFTTSANNYPIIWVHDADGVIIEDLVVDGAGKGNSNYRFVGIGYDNAGGTIEDVEIKDIRNTPINGTQHGVGILANSDEGTARTLIVNRCNIHDYQKNGATFNGADLAATITNNTVTGAGAVNFIAQNGIQVSFGATAEINNNTVSGHSYTPAIYVSAGMLLYFSNANTDGNGLLENQAGIYHINGSGLHQQNEVSASAAGTGSPYFWGIIADPGDVPRAKPDPFDAATPSSMTKSSKTKNTIAATYTYTLDRNVLTGDGSAGSFGIGAYVFGTDALDFTATANTVTKWEYGIELYKDAGATLNANIIDCNQIYDNTEFGVYNSTGIVANAVGNWWGDPTGPTHATNLGGTGDVVSDDVTFAPWGTSATCGGLALHNFVFLANEQVTIARSKHSASKGDIHSNGGIYFQRGDPNTYYGNLFAMSTIKIDKEIKIDGDATAGGKIILSGNAKILGTKTQYGTVTAIALPSLSYSAGGPNVTVAKKKTVSIAPGSYNNVIVNDGGTLKFVAGTYNLNSLETRDDENKLYFDVTNGPVIINIVSNLRLSEEVKVVIFPDGEDGSEKVTFNTMQSTQVLLGKESYVLGNIIAPNAEVYLAKNVSFRGSISAKRITVDRDVYSLHHSSPGTLPFQKGSADDGEELLSEQSIATDYVLSQNYPNPFNPSTRITFALPEAGRVQLHIYNSFGQLVRTLANRELAQGWHELMWDGRNQNGQTVATGVYLYQITVHDHTGAATFSETRRMSLVK